MGWHGIYQGVGHDHVRALFADSFCETSCPTSVYMSKKFVRMRQQSFVLHRKRPGNDATPVLRPYSSR